MKRIFWLILAHLNPVWNDELRRLGEGEYLAKHGVYTEVKIIEGEAIVKLDKHLHNYDNK